MHSLIFTDPQNLFRSFTPKLAWNYGRSFMIHCIDRGNWHELWDLISFRILFVEEHMYRMLNAFMLLKPAMDTGNVPEFYTFFNSSAVEVKFNILKKINCVSQRCRWIFLLIVGNWWMNYFFPDKLLHVLNYLPFINF